MKRWLYIAVVGCCFHLTAAQSSHRICYDFEPETPLPQWVGNWRHVTPPAYLSPAFQSRGALAIDSVSVGDLPPLLKIPLPNLPEKELISFEVEFHFKQNGDANCPYIWWSVSDLENGPRAWFVPFPEGKLEVTSSFGVSFDTPENLKLVCSDWNKLKICISPLQLRSEWSSCPKNAFLQIAILPAVESVAGFTLDNLCISYSERGVSLPQRALLPCKPEFRIECQGPD